MDEITLKVERGGTLNAEFLHGCLLDIALEIRRVCGENDLKFFLIAGSMLGAVRHGGIIPWDDDVDVGLLREDYEQLINRCSGDFKEPFILVNGWTEKNYGLPYSKVKIKGTVFQEQMAPDDNEQGIFVDIFPVDRIPDSKILRYIHKHVLRILYGVLLLKCGYKIEKNRSAARRLLHCFLYLVPKRFILWQITFWQTMFNGMKTQTFANLGGAYPYGREVFPQSSFDGELPYIKFEGYDFPVPIDSGKVLTSLYCDYMTPPPSEQQVFRHLTGIDFGDYIPHSVHVEQCPKGAERCRGEII